MSRVFSWCKSLECLDLSSWNTSKVTNMSRMLYHCFYLKEFSTNDWLIPNGTDMTSMFEGCEGLSESLNLDLSGFDMRKITDAGKVKDMLLECWADEIHTPKTLKCQISYCRWIRLKRNLVIKKRGQKRTENSIQHFRLTCRIAYCLNEMGNRKCISTHREQLRQQCQEMEVFPKHVRFVDLPKKIRYAEFQRWDCPRQIIHITERHRLRKLQLKIVWEPL